MRPATPALPMTDGQREILESMARSRTAPQWEVTRAMARAHGVSPATVQRIWSARGLQPHRVKTFKLSNDKRFEEKLVGVVGLYLNPPDKAVVLCMDEKSDPGSRPDPAHAAAQAR